MDAVHVETTPVSSVSSLANHSSDLDPAFDHWAAWEEHEENRRQTGGLFVGLHHVEGQLLDELRTQMILDWPLKAGKVKHEWTQSKWVLEAKKTSPGETSWTDCSSNIQVLSSLSLSLSLDSII